MIYRTFILIAALFSALVGCKSIGNGKDGSSTSTLSGRPELSFSEKIALHQNVISQSPIDFSKQIRSNDLATARITAAAMHETLETLESNRQLAAQVCFGANEASCSTFRQYMSKDIKSLYKGFVVSNSLSTGDLLKIATNIESSAALQYR